MSAMRGTPVWVYGESEAVILQSDNDGAIVRELDDNSETWFAWGDLHARKSAGVGRVGDNMGEAL